MKKLSAQFQAHLDSGTTTLCHCWRLTRQDGVQLGFTNHDKDLAFDGTMFEAVSGFLATEMRETIGLGVDHMEVDSALSSLSLTEEDLRAGLYDDARVEIFRVNWQDVSQFVLLRYGSLGEITRGSTRFSAEVRGMAHYLNQIQGRSYQYNCDTDLGSEQCGVQLTAPEYTLSAVVMAQEDFQILTIDNDSNFAPGWFSQGLLRWTSGQNQGLKMEVQRDYQEGSLRKLALWLPMVKKVQTGDQFVVTAGCDKQFTTCRERFNNSVNYRGFPHIPGNDFVLSYPGSNSPDMSGQSLQS